MTFHDFAQQQRGYLVRSQALAIGMTQNEINHLVNDQHWQRPHPGVYLTGSAAPDWVGKVRAGVFAAGGGARAMGRTAARLRGFDGAEKHAVIEVTVGYGLGPAPKGVIVRRTRRSDPSLTSVINGIAVSSVRETLLEYAWLSSPILTERAVEDAIRRGRTSEGALRRFLAGCGKGVNGVTALRAVLDGRPEGRPARSGFEVIVLDILRQFGLPLPLRRPLLFVPPDQKFELDLAYMDQLIDIEPMGDKWHSTARQRRYDAERVRVLESLGWQVVPVRWAEAVHTPAVVAQRLRDALHLASVRI
jgi:hypothetical protein